MSVEPANAWMNKASTRRFAWKGYTDRQQAALSQGGAERWAEAEAWLGRHDLFYLLVRLLRREDLNKEWLFDRCREVQRTPDNHLDLWAREHGKIPRFAEHVDPLAQIERRDRVFRMARACSACGSEQVQWRRLLLE